MKLEDQVCSLDLAKRLKELGVPQESYFYWDSCKYDDGDGHVDEINDLINIGSFKMNGGVRGFHTSAFTVAELGEMLRTIEKLGFHSGKTSISSDHIFCVADMVTGSGEFDYFIHSTVADNEANARAKMLVYLLENKPTKL